MTQASTSLPREAVAWVFAPHFIGNPFQALLTMGMADHDIAPIGAASVADGVRVVTTAHHVRQRVLHLHWLNGVLAGASTREEAQKRVAAFERQLDSVQAVGTKLVWTMHNVLPHESVFEDLEVRIRESIVGRADMVHIMNPDSIGMAGPYFDLPASKVVRVEHPGYQGYYPQWMSRAAARQHFGFTPGEQVLLVLGALADPLPQQRDLRRLERLVRLRRPHDFLFVLGLDALQQRFLELLVHLAKFAVLVPLFFHVFRVCGGAQFG